MNKNQSRTVVNSKLSGVVSELETAKTPEKVHEIVGNSLKMYGEKLNFFQKIKAKFRKMIPTKAEKIEQKKRNERFSKKYSKENLFKDFFKKERKNDKELIKEDKKIEILNFIEFDVTKIPRDLLMEVPLKLLYKVFSNISERREAEYFYEKLKKEGISQEKAEEIIREKYISKNGEKKTFLNLLEGSIKDKELLKSIKKEEELFAVAKSEKIKLQIDVLKGKKTEKEAKEELDKHIRKKIKNNPELSLYYSGIVSHYAKEEATENLYNAQQGEEKISREKITKVVEISQQSGLDLSGLTGVKNENGNLTFEISPKKTLDGVKTRITIEVTSSGEFFVKNKLFDKDKNNKKFSSKLELDKIVNFSEYNAILYQLVRENLDNSVAEELERKLKDEGLEIIIKSFEKQSFTPNQNPKKIFAKIIEKIIKNQKERIINYLFNLANKKTSETRKISMSEKTNEVIKDMNLGTGKMKERKSQGIS